MRRLRRLFWRIAEVVLFIPVIWNLYTWDFTGLFAVLEHWLSRMRKEQEKDIWHSNNHIHANNIRICEILCQRLRCENYDEAFFEEHDKRWGKAKYTFVPSDTHKDCRVMKSHRTNIITDRDRILERKEFRAIIDHAEKLWQQDITYLFKMLRKNVRKWWT